MKTFLVALLGVLALGYAEALAAPLPEGWIAEAADAGGRQVFKPAQPAPHEETSVVYYPRKPLGKLKLEFWLREQLAKDPPPTGCQWKGAPQVRGETSSVAQAQRNLISRDGLPGMAVYLALSADRKLGRIARWTANTMVTAKRYQGPGKVLLNRLAEIENERVQALDEKGTHTD